VTDAETVEYWYAEMTTRPLTGERHHLREPMFSDHGAIFGSARVEPAALRAGLPILDALIVAGIAGTRNEARTLVRQRGVRVQGRTIDDAGATVRPEAGNDYVLIHYGKNGIRRIVGR
jgi:tyrosyl-tRNA synthetase